MRHVAIVGMSFCGSTLLGRILGALPGVVNIGESHWIRTPPLPGANARMCSECGDSCPILSQAFMAGLADDPSGWYGKIARRFGTEILVSSDKNFDIITSLDPSLDLDVVLVFRFPPDCWNSYRRAANVPAEVGPLLERDRYYWYWTNFYGHALYNFRNRGRFVAVDFDAFVREPTNGLRHLCDRLSLPFSSDALDYWKRTQHSIGGNGAVVEALRIRDIDSLKVRPRPGAIGQAALQDFQGHPTASHLHSYLVKAAQDGTVDRVSVFAPGC